ncbi:MAG TPA: tetratricopeptide repeat protein [Polyangia bacterium]|nr:tetratricopeptide repeat protein [Polyangia bacterium]
MEGPNELREIRKEIIEARGLIIKSNNLASSLNAEIRSIGKRQVSYERHLTLNSVVAYVVFVVLVFTGVQLAYNQRQASLEASLKAERERAAEFEKKVAAFEVRNKDTGKNQNQDLLALFELINTGDRQGAIDAYDGLDKERLSELERKLLERTIEGFRGDLSMEHFARGLEFVEQKKHAEAVEEFRQSLRYKGDSGHAKAAKIQLANALRLQGKPREAIAVLQRLIEEHLDRDLLDDAYWYLALSHQEAHQRDEARSVLRALMRQFPDSQYYRAARIRVNELQLRLYTEPE